MSASYVCAFAQQVVHWPVTAKEPFRSEDNPCEIFVVTVARNKYFSNYFGVFLLVLFHWYSIFTLILPISGQVETKPRNLRSAAISDIVEHKK